MRIAFDTNVLIDAIANRADHEAAQSLIMAVAEEKVSGVISANSVTDIYYIARKLVGDESARNAIWNLMTVFDVAPVDGEACATALSVEMSDYEDAVLAVCAEREGIFKSKREPGRSDRAGSLARCNSGWVRHNIQKC